MNRRWRLTLAFFVVAAVVGGLAIRSIADSASVYYTVDQYLSRGAAAWQRQAEVKGEVVPGSIRWDGARLDLSFELQNNGKVLPVRYRGMKPETLQAGIEAVVTGSMRDGAFQASGILVKCPSKYVPKSGGNG
ncbi:MAG: cytochrome c maturation protein CcmE [Bacillota bacterium]|nr:cytochrome c maturation protein CcmE [Bacillota bacterium]